jgi:hypothetical protein
MDKIQFLATIPPIQSGLKFGGDGARIQLDIPETELSEAAKLILCKNKVLKVTVEIKEG